MSGIDVVITPIHIGDVVVWKIKRWVRGTPFMGWARIDGTFTPGLNPGLEGEQSMVSRTEEYAIEFAQEHGWNVVGTIKP